MNKYPKWFENLLLSVVMYWFERNEYMPERLERLYYSASIPRLDPTKKIKLTIELYDNGERVKALNVAELKTPAMSVN